MRRLDRKWLPALVFPEYTTIRPGPGFRRRRWECAWCLSLSKLTKDKGRPGSFVLGVFHFSKSHRWARPEQASFPLGPVSDRACQGFLLIWNTPYWYWLLSSVIFTQRRMKVNIDSSLANESRSPVWMCWICPRQRSSEPASSRQKRTMNVFKGGTELFLLTIFERIDKLVQRTWLSKATRFLHPGFQHPTSSPWPGNAQRAVFFCCSLTGGYQIIIKWEKAFTNNCTPYYDCQSFEGWQSFKSKW